MDQTIQNMISQIRSNIYISEDDQESIIRQIEEFRAIGSIEEIQSYVDQILENARKIQNDIPYEVMNSIVKLDERMNALIIEVETQKYISRELKYQLIETIENLTKKFDLIHSDQIINKDTLKSWWIEFSNVQNETRELLQQSREDVLYNIRIFDENCEYLYQRVNETLPSYSKERRKLIRKIDQYYRQFHEFINSDEIIINEKVQDWNEKLDRFRIRMEEIILDYITRHTGPPTIEQTTTENGVIGGNLYEIEEEKINDEEAIEAEDIQIVGPITAYVN